MPNEDRPADAHGVGSSDLLGVAYRGSDGAITCALCDYECEWGECYNGCDDGYFDGYEEDPLWYDQGDLVRCGECGGQGGHWYCDNKECKTGEIRRVLKHKPNVRVSESPPENQKGKI